MKPRYRDARTPSRPPGWCAACFDPAPGLGWLCGRCQNRLGGMIWRGQVLTLEVTETRSWANLGAQVTHG